ncbi:MAG: HNH endonuclease [Planctomycetes bacterium]|nr:HNH endonuclease [Planctomycetota bacterium]
MRPVALALCPPPEEVQKLLAGASRNAWKDPRVLEWLRDVFLKKCAYCEKAVTGGVREHFQPQRDPAVNPNAWDNLRLGCYECNGNKERMRGGSRHDPSCNYFLLDPCAPDFRTAEHFKAVPVPERGSCWQSLQLQGLTPEGKAVIEFLKLGPGSDYPRLRGAVLDRYRKTKSALATLEAKGPNFTRSESHRVGTLRRQIASIFGDATEYIGALRLHLGVHGPPAGAGHFGNA